MAGNDAGAAAVVDGGTTGGGDTGGGATGAPAPDTSEAMTDAERAYFSSKGEANPYPAAGYGTGGDKADAGEGEGTGKAGEGTGKAGEGEAKAGEGAGSGDEGELEPGEVTIDKEGQLHDPKTGRFVPKSAYLRVKEENKAFRDREKQLVDNIVSYREGLGGDRAGKAGEGDGSGGEGDGEGGEELSLDGIKEMARTDLFGAFDKLLEKVGKDATTLTKTTQETAAELAAQRTRVSFEHDAATFSKEQPAFTEGFGFLVEQVGKELEAMGITDAAKRSEQISAQARNIIDEAIKAGVSPSKRLYALAEARGFKPKPAEGEGDAEAKKKADAEPYRRSSGSGRANPPANRSAGQAVAGSAISHPCQSTRSWTRPKARFSAPTTSTSTDPPAGHRSCGGSVGSVNTSRKPGHEMRNCEHIGGPTWT